MGIIIEKQTVKATKKCWKYKEIQHFYAQFFKTDFHDVLIAFDWPISVPDIVQSNSLQVRFVTSNLSRIGKNP